MNTGMIARYLHFLRKGHGYTQDSLAKRLGVSRQAVSKWETGAAIPDLEVLLEISRLYGVTVNDILEPKALTQRITDFEQIPSIPEGELREALKQLDDAALATALMGASPEVNDFMERVFPGIGQRMAGNQVCRVRVGDVERMQEMAVSMINLSYATGMDP